MALVYRILLLELKVSISHLSSISLLLQGSRILFLESSLLISQIALLTLETGVIKLSSLTTSKTIYEPWVIILPCGDPWLTTAVL